MNAEQRLAAGGRRLSDKILVAFHQACDQDELETAAELLKLVELILERPAARADNNNRRKMESLVSAHERLWLLRHPAY